MLEAPTVAELPAAVDGCSAVDRCPGGLEARPGKLDGRPGKHRRPRPKWKFSFLAALIVLLLWGATGALLYPTASNWVYQYNQSKIISQLNTEIDQVTPPKAEQIRLAQEYNRALQFGAEVEKNHRLPTGFGVNQDESLDYNQILSLGSEKMMGRIRVPKADVDLPIYHGTSDDVLMKGIGHLEGTSLPVGGKGTHTVLTGHRGLAQAAMFTHLDRVEVGDRFTLEIFGLVLTYEVTDIRVVDPEQTESLRVDADRDLATLITCTPLGINTQRILVTGERVYPTPQSDLEQAGKASDLPRFPWWILVIVAVLAGSIIFMWRSGYPPKARKSRKTRKAARAQNPQSRQSPAKPIK